MIAVWIFFSSSTCPFDLDDNEAPCKGKLSLSGNFLKPTFFRGCNFTAFCRSPLTVKRARQIQQMDLLLCRQIIVLLLTVTVNPLAADLIE